MTLISSGDPNIQGFARRFAEQAVDFLASINALNEGGPRPEPGTQAQVTVESQSDGLRITLITEWRTNDLTRHVRMWELESGELLLDVVYAEGGNEELEQALIDDLWLASLIEASLQSRLLPSDEEQPKP